MEKNEERSWPPDRISPEEWQAARQDFLNVLIECSNQEERDRLRCFAHEHVHFSLRSPFSAKKDTPFLAAKLERGVEQDMENVYFSEWEGIYVGQEILAKALGRLNLETRKRIANSLARKNLRLLKHTYQKLMESMTRLAAYGISNDSGETQRKNIITNLRSNIGQIRHQYCLLLQGIIFEELDA
ncbi:MAG: hypothetical protein Q7R81_01260 [Candidatus Peregrinibacteria bacterium]|nr:hypothetical protein [Candidatus Peregrinibacteria bacterium]